MRHIKATPAAVPVSVICEDCDKVIEPGARVSCFLCAGKHVTACEAEARADERKGHAPASQAIRDWAKHRYTLGQIDASVRLALELCAEDLEVANGN